MADQNILAKQQRLRDTDWVFDEKEYGCGNN